MCVWRPQASHHPAWSSGLLCPVGTIHPAHLPRDYHEDQLLEVCQAPVHCEVPCECGADCTGRWLQVAHLGHVSTCGPAAPPRAVLGMQEVVMSAPGSRQDPHKLTSSSFQSPFLSLLLHHHYELSFCIEQRTCFT